MKLWLISQTENNDWDTYDSAVVAANTEDDARNTAPYQSQHMPQSYSWCSSPDKVTVELIGTAKRGIPAGVICASFNAG